MNKKNTGNQDEQEKARKLSEDEQKRLEAFEQLSEGMVREGYRRVELTVSIRKANLLYCCLFRCLWWALDCSFCGIIRSQKVFMPTRFSLLWRSISFLWLCMN